MKMVVRFLFVVQIGIVFLFLFSNCTNKNSEYIDPRGNEYAGAESCLECHSKIYNEALKSSHHKASAAASTKNVLGNFRQGHNIYSYDKQTKIVMENRNNELFQVLHKNGKELKAYRFDIVLGSKNAQTSLFWNNDIVYELPLSYYTAANNWGTSPGYAPDAPYFESAVTAVCFECHSSNIEVKHKNTEAENYFGTEVKPETMKKESIVFGIDCERCHGPAKDHVDYHKRNPGLKLAKYIVPDKSLNTQQKLVGCVLCHSAAESVQSRFKFVPGNTIADFYNEPALNSGVNPDVHGNQYGLLAKSKCFIKSRNMDCTSCHDPHDNASESVLVQSQKCMNCHSMAKNNFCTTKDHTEATLKNNCIDCHMPKKESTAIGFFLSGKKEMSPYLMRTHQIGIFPQGTKNTISKNK